MGAKIYQFEQYRRKKRNQANGNSFQIPFWQLLGTLANILLLQVIGWTFAVMCFNPPANKFFGRMVAIVVVVVLLYHLFLPLIYFLEKAFIKESEYFQSYVFFSSIIVFFGLLVGALSEGKTVYTYLFLLAGFAFVSFNALLFHRWNQTKKHLSND